MGRKIKAGTKGEASQYLTRSNAIRRLQLPLQDFRRLCILKGIYPREPKKKFKGNDKTYFHVKDLKILEHDTLIDKFREIKAHLKKHKKLLGRKETKLAEKHIKKTPRYSLAPVIKDRYPTFVDALRDLDDALCLISLFAQFPQHLTLDIKKSDIEQCQQLFKEFMLYCTVSQCFKKAFLSIKGIYYQVEIMGQNITWISPFQFNQRLPFDVDYKVMGTFLEFYMALLKFINFKLFSDLGLEYPVKFDKDQIHVDPDNIREMQAYARKKFQDGQEQQNLTVSEEFKDTPEMILLNKKNEEQKRQRKLFANCNFLFGRETPVYALQYLVLSFGGYFYVDEDDESKDRPITHHVLDRPMKGITQSKKREYVQPQYLIDSLNNLFLLPSQPYKPGIAAPPHLSPFVDNEQEGYIPDRQREIDQLKGVTKEIVESSDEDEEEQEEQNNDDDNDEEEDVDMRQGGDADSSSEEEDEEKLEQEKQKKNAKLKRDLKKEQEEMGKILMTKRQRQLYKKAEDEKKSKKEMAKKLKSKKKQIEK